LLFSVTLASVQLSGIDRPWLFFFRVGMGWFARHGSGLGAKKQTGGNSGLMP
jgi:hypothetical protein